jgi:hypothetical protein
VSDFGISGMEIYDMEIFFYDPFWVGICWMRRRNWPNTTFTPKIWTWNAPIWKMCSWR